MNPLLEDFNTAPFSKISSTDYKPAIKKAIEICKKEIETIISNPETPSFKNTTEALEFTGQKLGRITSIFFNLNSAETSEAIQKIAQEISPWLSEFKNDMILNSALFIKVKSVYDIRETLNLDPEQSMLLEKQYKGFSRNGANLNDEDKEKLRKIDTELSRLSLQFGENVLADGNAFELHITHEKDLKGLPDGAKEAASLLAKNRNKEGWLITLDYPSYIPFVTYAENRELRKKLSIAFGKKAHNLFVAFCILFSIRPGFLFAKCVRLCLFNVDRSSSPYFSAFCKSFCNLEFSFSFIHNCTFFKGLNTCFTNLHSNF